MFFFVIGSLLGLGVWCGIRFVEYIQVERRRLRIETIEQFHELRAQLEVRLQLRHVHELKSLPPSRDHEHRLWNLNCRSDGSPVFPKEEA